MGLQINPAISFSILTHNEDYTLEKLLSQLFEYKQLFDEIIIVDDFSDNQKTIDILISAKIKGAKVYKHSLNGDFAQQKNYANSKCSNLYIFNIDADELISSSMLEHLRNILESNPNIDVFKLPRVNTVDGITKKHLDMWRWRINKFDDLIGNKNIDKKSEEYKLLKDYNLIISEKDDIVEYHLPVINWPDFQYRIYKNSPDIYWRNKVHEVIYGHKTFAEFPSHPDFSLIHHKDIARQEIQNNFYNTI
jgi:glycosyltransferase involved in cell wall biosynthesis